jgi:hypothetical protein
MLAGYGQSQLHPEWWSVYARWHGRPQVRVGWTQRIDHPTRRYAWRWRAWCDLAICGWRHPLERRRHLAAAALERHFRAAHTQEGAMATEWFDDPAPTPRRLDPLDPGGLAVPWSAYSHPDDTGDMPKQAAPPYRFKKETPPSVGEKTRWRLLIDLDDGRIGILGAAASFHHTPAWAAYRFGERHAYAVGVDGRPCPPGNTWPFPSRRHAADAVVLAWQRERAEAGQARQKAAG